jgi:hypothetical protein
MDDCGMNDVMEIRHISMLILAPPGLFTAV